MYMPNTSNDQKYTNQTPIKNKYHSCTNFDDLDSLPTRNSKASSPSTFDSPNISSYKDLQEDLDSMQQLFCQKFQEEGFCDYGKNCGFDHKQDGMKLSKFHVLNNYPELLVMIGGRRSISYLV